MSQNKYKENIVKKMDQQIEKGYNKYGYTLEDNVGLDVFERLNHFREELIDALFYIEHLETKLKEK